MLAAVDHFLARPRTLPHRMAVVVTSLATVAVVLVSIVILTNWRLPWIPSATERLIEDAHAAAARGDEVGAIRSYSAALERSPTSGTASAGVICGLWSVGYADAAAVALQIDLQFHELGTREEVDEACVLADPTEFGLATISSDYGSLLIAVSDPPSQFAARLLDENSQADATSGWREMLVAACVNIDSGLHFLAGYQLSLAFSDPNLSATSGYLRSCVRTRIPDRFETYTTDDGVELVRPTDYATRRFVPGASPVPPPTTIPLPPVSSAGE